MHMGIVVSIFQGIGLREKGSGIGVGIGVGRYEMGVAAALAK